MNNQSDTVATVVVLTMTKGQCQSTRGNPNFIQFTRTGQAEVEMRGKKRKSE